LAIPKPYSQKRKEGPKFREEEGFEGKDKKGWKNYKKMFLSI